MTNEFITLTEEELINKLHSDWDNNALSSDGRLYTLSFYDDLYYCTKEDPDFKLLENKPDKFIVKRYDIFIFTYQEALKLIAEGEVCCRRLDNGGWGYLESENNFVDERGIPIDPTGNESSKWGKVIDIIY